MRITAHILLLALLGAYAAAAEPIQTDWSGGSGQPGPVPSWGISFAGSAGASWLAVPGQLALSSSALVNGVSHLLSDNQPGAFGVAAADVDGDGDVDIVGSAELSGVLTFWSNDGAVPPAFTAQIIDAAYPEVSGLAIADLDGDQDLDLVACTGAIAGRVTCYLNEGGSPVTWTPRDLETNWSQAWDIATGDVDGDGHLDVIGTNLGQGDVVWWRNDGAQPLGWTRLAIDASFSGAHSARAGDIDGDGRADILGTGTTANQVAWWRNEGGQPLTWTKRVIASGFFGGRSVRLGDIDGDGDLDAAACGFNNRVMWWANQGGTPVTWTEQLVSASVAQAHQLQLADISGDGRLDIVVAAYGGNMIVWFENGGGTAPIAWTRTNLDTQLAKPLAVNTGDIDGDGALEIVGSSNTGNLFRWYDATAFVAAGELTASVLDRGASGPALLDWSASSPPGTGVALQIRTGASPETLGSWSEPIPAPGTLVDTAGRFLQYRAILTTADPSLSPRLHEVALHPAASPVPSPASDPGMEIHPNPANPRAVISFELPRAMRVELAVFDLRGRIVRTLADTELAAGRHEVIWDGNDRQGRSVASGSYLASLVTEQGAVRSRMTLLR